MASGVVYAVAIQDGGFHIRTIVERHPVGFGLGNEAGRVSILVDKIMESMRTDGFDAYDNAYEKWYKQVPQLAEKYLKGYSVREHLTDFREC